jgi:hypothetical protein
MSKSSTLYIQGPLESSKTFSNYILAIKAFILQSRSSSFPPYHVTLSNYNALKSLINKVSLEIEEYRIFEPIWPAEKFLTRKSLTSISVFIFSFTKMIDIVVFKFLPNYGSRFFLGLKIKTD